MSRPKIIDVVPATRQRPWPKSRDELVRMKLELDKKHQRLHKLLVDAREQTRITGIRADQGWYDSMLAEIKRVNRLRMEAEDRLGRMKSGARRLRMCAQ